MNEDVAAHLNNAATIFVILLTAAAAAWIVKLLTDD